MKYIRICFLIILLITLFSHYEGISFKKSKTVSALSVKRGQTVTQLDQVVANQGNSYGNITNGGYAAIQGDWVYYRNEDQSNELDSATLYRQNLVSGVKEKISNDSAHYINVIGEWIYYGKYTSGVRGFHSGPIYKIRTDGTNRTQLNNDISVELNVIGEFIYYISRTDANKIYRMKTDGTEVTKLVDEDCQNLNVTKDWVYYTSNSGISKIKLDGSGKERIFNGKVGTMIIDDKWLYYSTGRQGVYDWTDKGFLYKIKVDGTEHYKVTDEMVFNFTVHGGNIYYSVEEPRRKFLLYMMDSNGNNKRKIAQATAGNIVGDWMYFHHYYAEWSELERIRLDGTGHEKVSTGGKPMVPYIKE
ncbi:DUF5050 domain-containing protein [Acetonema longum]|uniref:Cell wall binding repeat 2-containing protein n=1 Tax=Acetonema longum DSM 6540 TaxID=1009370 RepID=F7NJJ4_9FIRM|nr:DUF5050 domain-containing protein [Acetonema longum]EGO63788.1 cell wall binding repeat 2-containing protein [Acetonema longum DSM 6540]